MNIISYISVFKEILLCGISFLCFTLLYILPVGVKRRSTCVLLNENKETNKTAQVANLLNSASKAMLLHDIGIVHVLAYRSIFLAFILLAQLSTLAVYVSIYAVAILSYRCLDIVRKLKLRISYLCMPFHGASCAYNYALGLFVVGSIIITCWK